MQENNSNPDKKPILSWSTPSAMKPAIQKALPSAGATTSLVGRYVGIFSAGLIVGILISWGYTSATSRTIAANPQTTKTVVTTDKAASPAAGVVIGTDGNVASNSALEVISPQKAGLSVAVSKVTVGKPVWVVVYEGRGGKPGNVLGAHLFFSTGPGTVTLLRATTAGAEYFVGTSEDNGDRKFSKAADKPAVFEDGTLSTARFTAN